jgi:O-antigen/teichoic acid export membrane protein
MLVNSFFSELAIFIRARWWPKFKFSRESFHYLFRFGINGLGFSITSYLRQNLDYLVVGRLLGTATLGLYEFAYRIPHLVLDRISRPVGAVVFPSLAKVQDNNEILVNGYIKSVKYICLVTFPMLFGLAAVADIAVPILWGEQWLPIVVPMQLLCVCAALRMIPQPLGAIFNCKNRPDLPFKISLIGLLWTVSVVGGLAYYYGLIGIAFGMVLAVLDGYVSLFIAFKMIDAKVKNLLLKILPVLICSLLSSISSYLFIVIFENKFNSSTLLIASISVGVLVYFYSIYVFFRPIYDEIIGNISSFKVG